jgi:hypothetical protein
MKLFINSPSAVITRVDPEETAFMKGHFPDITGALLGTSLMSHPLAAVTVQLLEKLLMTRLSMMAPLSMERRIVNWSPASKTLTPKPM